MSPKVKPLRLEQHALDMQTMLQRWCMHSLFCVQVAAHRLARLAQSTADSISQQYKVMVAATAKALGSLQLGEHADRLTASAADTWRKWVLLSSLCWRVVD